MRSTAIVPRDSYEIGDARYQPHERTVLREGKEFRLEPRIAALLNHLTDHAGEVVRRDDLLDAVWGDEGSDEALTQAVSKLRHVLGNRSLILTEPRQGYRLAVQPALVGVIEPEESGAASVKQAERMYSVRALQMAFGSGFILALLMSALAWAWFGPEEVTVFEEVTAPADGVGEPSTRTVRCEGSPEECAGEIYPE